MINVPIIEAFTDLVTHLALCILCIVFCKIISTAPVLMIMIIIEQMVSFSVLPSKLALGRWFRRMGCLPVSEGRCPWLHTVLSTALDSAECVTACPPSFYFFNYFCRMLRYKMKCSIFVVQ